MQLSCLLRSVSMSCLFACLWWQHHPAKAGTGIASKEIKNVVLLIPHTEEWGKVEGEQANPSNKCNFLFSVLGCTLLLCNKAVIGDNQPSRWFKLFSAFSCLFCASFLLRDLTLKLFNQKSDFLLML